MTWDELLERFRSFGGIVENVRLASGRFGRGLFPIDPLRPATMHTPERLMVPVEDVEIVDGQMDVTSQSRVGSAEREFFRDYHRYFGWGTGIEQELWRTQEAWSRLPAELVASINSMSGLGDPGMRFLPPTQDLCRYLYVRTRCFLYDGKTYLTPMTELANHSSSAAGYTIGGGIGVTGTYAGEMLVRYNLDDSWARVLQSSFSDAAVYAHSLAITIDVDGRHRLSIQRDTDAVTMCDGIRFPRAVRQGDSISLPFVPLGFTAGPDLPRAIFRSLLNPELGTSRADEVFDSVAHFNRTKFLGFLRALDGHDGPVVAALKEATMNQLETLSYCVGARALP